MANLDNMDDFFKPQQNASADVSIDIDQEAAHEELKQEPDLCQVNPIETTNIQRKQITVEKKEEEEKPKGIKGKKRNRKQINMDRVSDEIDELVPTKKKAKLGQNVAASSFAVRPSNMFSKEPSKLTRTAAGFRQ